MKKNILVFSHPCTQQVSSRIWPVFMPFLGCKAICIYCNQPAVTGFQPTPVQDIYDKLSRTLAKALYKKTAPLELAFFGGTFTALPLDWCRRFIALGEHFRQKGLITRIRCSTSPHAVNPKDLTVLQKEGLDMVELGIQTFEDRVLSLCHRGYNREKARTACFHVQEAGLLSGIQLMPGLPGQDEKIMQQDIQEAVALGPAVMRLYPCTVLKNTELARWYREKKYAPLSLDKTISFLGKALLTIWQAGIQVIRIGLPQEQNLEQEILAGPIHPALGQLARSEALFLYIQNMVQSGKYKPASLAVPTKYYSDVIGHKQSMLPRFKNMGLEKENFKVTTNKDFILHYNA